MNFSEALNLIKKGKKLQRKNWNGKDMWITVCYSYTVHDVPFNIDWNAERKMLPFIIMKTVDNNIVPWLASQTDILAEDWILI
jgi:hypothetical protein